jgi:hypothetical protein
LAKFYHGFLLKLGDGKLSRVKTSQSEDPEEARVPGKKGGSRIPRRGPRGRSHSSQPPLGAYAPDIIPNTFPDVKGWSPSPHLQGRGKDHWGIAVNKKPLGNTMGRKLLSLLL